MRSSQRTAQGGHASAAMNHGGSRERQWGVGVPQAQGILIPRRKRARHVDGTGGGDARTVGKVKVIVA